MTDFILKQIFKNLMNHILIAFSLLIAKLRSEPIPIDLADQHGTKNHHGHGDIVELWEENQKKNATSNKWTNEWNQKEAKYVIPYTITGKFSFAELNVIAEAMQKIEENCCVKFVSRNLSLHRDFIDIQNEDGEGCYANVGRLPGRNIVMLESTDQETCVTDQTVLHELFHKLGLWHEHMRADRDSHIQVHFEHIPFYLHNQFRVLSTNEQSAERDNFSIRYNYRSLMHYGEHAFAALNAISIETRKRKFQKVIGMAMDASAGDWIQICAMYNCSECMKRAFDVVEESKQFNEEMEADEEESDEVDEEEEEEDVCHPLPDCGKTITRQSHSSPALWKIACCEPCRQCVPNASICNTPNVRELAPLVFKYDCCGRCKKINK